MVGSKLVLSVATVALLAAGTGQCKPVQKCNGAAALCDRTYDQVAYATTHNAMANADDGWKGPNQEHDVPQQLADGVRGLMLDVHLNSTDTAPNLAAPDAPDGVPLLCHAYCINGWQRLTDGLAEIDAFLDTHPNEVVTIIFESYVDPAAIEADFVASGAIDHVAEHTPGTPWPTLRQMIASGDRLVVLTDDGGGSYPWYLPVWSEAFETHYSAKTPDDLSCAVNRGSSSNRLFILNHFLTDPIGRRTLADQVNFDPFFIDRAEQCETERAHLPNFVTVDFYDRGDTLAVVHALNGV